MGGVVGLCMVGVWLVWVYGVWGVGRVGSVGYGVDVELGVRVMIGV